MVQTNLKLTYVAQANLEFSIFLVSASWVLRL
jgi:hypothetical protein